MRSTSGTAYNTCNCKIKKTTTKTDLFPHCHKKWFQPLTEKKRYADALGQKGELTQVN